MAFERLTPLERDLYLRWHADNAVSDLKDSQDITSHKWSIIAGYYAMHNAAKYYLGKVYGIKITSPQAHNTTLELLDKKLKATPTYKQVHRLIKDAQMEYENLIGADAQTIADYYSVGKEKREKQSYYSGFHKRREDAPEFIVQIVKPFMKIIMELNE